MLEIFLIIFDEFFVIGCIEIECFLIIRVVFFEMFEFVFLLEN